MKETIPWTEAERKRSNIKRKKRRTREQKNRINNEKKWKKDHSEGRWKMDNLDSREERLDGEEGDMTKEGEGEGKGGRIRSGRSKEGGGLNEKEGREGGGRMLMVKRLGAKGERIRVAGRNLSGMIQQMKGEKER